MLQVAKFKLEEFVKLEELRKEVGRLLRG